MDPKFCPQRCNWLLFVTETASVLCEVGTGFHNIFTNSEVQKVTKSS